MNGLRVLTYGLLQGAVLLSSVTASAQTLQRAASSAASTIANASTQSNLSISVGGSMLLDCSSRVQRIAVGLGGFAEAIAISPTEILVNGKVSGQTSLIVWEQGGKREFYDVTVRAAAVDAMDRVETVRREFAKELPGQDVKVSAENGAVFLSGTVKDLNSSDRAVQIASLAGKVVNLLNVEIPAAQPQILLKVMFASLDRSKSTQLGINVFNNGLGNVIGSLSTGQFSPPAAGITGASVSSDLNLFTFFPGLNLGATIEALQSNGIVQVLSQPNVLTESGKQGSFLAGGEYPYPVVQGTGGSAGPTVTIQFKEYGIRLNFIPTLTQRGTIHLQVAPEVSSLDFTNAVTVSGFTVPAIDVRKVKTEIELNAGQSFAIGGLLDNRVTQTLQKVPYISNVPVLGKFFQSISKSKTNTELIVIVTPEIVTPIPQGKPLPAPDFPLPFLPSGRSLSTDSAGTATPVAGAVPARTTMPVEELERSLKATKSLVVEGSFTPGSGSAASGGGQSTAASQ